MNPRQPAWKAGTLPLSYARLFLLSSFTRSSSQKLFGVHPARPLASSPAHANPHINLNLRVLSRRQEQYDWLRVEQALYGGQARIRTLEDISQQIYSLPPLATWVPARHNPLTSKKSISFLGFFFDTGVIKKSKPLRAQLSLLTKRMTADVLGQANLGNAGFY